MTGWLFPHYPTLFILRSQRLHPSLSILHSPNTFHRILMAYFNNLNAARFYPISSTSFGEFDTYPTQISAIEQVIDESPHTFTNGRSMGRQSGDAVVPSTSPRAEGSIGKYDYVPSVIAVLPVLPQNLCPRPRHMDMINCHARDNTGP